ncbi:nickel/cobalt transporter [Stappia sp.]|uniref:nickel/cobalt transporter n=1 Tax=Stappia sp. TaxID=1870903 RepID=UPI003A9947B4
MTDPRNAAPGIAGRRFALSLAGGAVLAIILSTAAAHAAPSPFGVGLPEQSLPSGGILSGFFAWVSAQQTAFYGALTSALKQMKADGSAGWWLMGLSFLYGVFHAAGPGHGKAVISSYVLANGETLRRGIVISFASALAQAVTAVLVIGLASIVLRMTSIAITETTRWLEVGSYAAVTGLGVYLVWRKIARPMLTPRKVVALGAQAVVACDHEDHHGHAHDRTHGHRHETRHAHAHDHAHTHEHEHGHGHDHGHAHDHDHSESQVCASCGHVHAPPPQMLAGDFSLSRAWTVILAVGLRPCTGALVVLVFAISQELAWAGVAATFAMAVGTGLTVSVLATMAVLAKDAAMRTVGGRGAARLHAAIEGFGALVVLALGSTLLVAALGWGGAV